MNAGEFAWKNASPGKGAVSAIVHGLKYLVLPLLLVISGLFAVARAEGAQEFEGLLQELQTLVLIFGLIMIVLGFMKGAYPKGSVPRFTIGLTIAVLAIVYVYSLLLGGRLQTAISDEDFELDLYLLFALYFVIAVFNVLMVLGEFVDHRHIWLEKNGQVVPQEKEDPEQHRWFHDFRLRYGSLYFGFKLSKATLVGFVIIPLAIVIIIKAAFTALNSDEMDTLLESLDNISTFSLMLGLPMTVLAFFKGFYPRGSFSRFLPAVINVLIGLYWIWVLGLEGKFVAEFTGGVHINLDYSALLLLLIFGNALWIAFYLFELWLCRPEWKEGGFQKDLHEDRKVRREARRTAKEAGRSPAPEPASPVAEKKEGQ